MEVCLFATLTLQRHTTDMFKNLIEMITTFSFIAGSNQPPRFLNYFFSTYLLIYEDMPVGESHIWMHLCCLNTCTGVHFCVNLKKKKKSL